MRMLVIGFVLHAALGFTAAAQVQPQGIPKNAAAVSWGKGWECNSDFVERSGDCISIGQATDDEIRDYLVARSIAGYSGSCPCPYNRDRAGRRCGGRSAYSRPGGRSPLCYARDISDELVRRTRERYRRP